MSVFVRLLFQDNCKVVCDDFSRFVPSQFYPYPMKRGLNHALIRGIIKPTDYILGPVYRNNEVQIGVTGTAELNEEITSSAGRELGEEIGLIPNTLTDLKLIRIYKWERQNHGPVDFTVFSLNMDNCQPVQTTNKMGLHSDDRKRKIGCLLFGRYEQVINFLQSEKIYRYHSNDDIIGIAAVRAGDVNELYRK